MDNSMTFCAWEEIGTFHSLIEFRRFQSWMAGQIAAGTATEIAVAVPYSGLSSLTEKWFRHIESGQVWRLVWPDGPFAGVFKRVEKYDQHRERGQ